MADRWDPQSKAGLSRLDDDLQHHFSFGDKLSGSAGDRATSDWIASRLSGAGLAVQSEAMEVPWFEQIQCTLSTGMHVTAVEPQPVVVGTGPMGITSKLAVIREPFEAEDANGRIALVVLPHGRHASMESLLVARLVRGAVDAGAKAVVIVTTGPTGLAVGLNCRLNAMVQEPPMAVMAPSAANPFLLAARRGETATLVLHGQPGKRHTMNIHGRRVRGDRWLALSTPRTGWFNCASERGTGTVAFLWLAEWTLERFSDMSLFVMNAGAHEYMFAGARELMRHAPAPAITHLWVHLGASLAARDFVEMRGGLRPLPTADSNRTVMSTETIRTTVSAAFAGLSGLERPMDVMAGSSELGEIVAHGHERAFAVLGIPRQFHTRSDDLSCVDASMLAPVIKAHMRAIEDLLR